jgi:hypothetical protein
VKRTSVNGKNFFLRGKFYFDSGSFSAVPESEWASLEKFLHGHYGLALEKWPHEPLRVCWRNHRFHLSDHPSPEHAGIVLVSYAGQGL